MCSELALPVPSVGAGNVVKVPIYFPSFLNAMRSLGIPLRAPRYPEG
jgi:hypothetical protein